MAKINLDAIIPREDFEDNSIIDDNSSNRDTISITDIETFFFTYLRKPDFQRETNEWDKDKIVDFIESFLDGDLIPAIILWKAKSGSIFVIDGSHRLSALKAWVNNDYGDGDISKKFYDSRIPEEQIDAAEQTRTLIRKKIGAYQDFKLALNNPEKVDREVVLRAKKLASLGIKLQWVTGDAKKAESSFLKINQKASPINTTELKLLEARKKPNCISARAIIKGGIAHIYWANFSSENQSKIQNLAKEINEILFQPKLETPIKTLDLPIGGAIYKAQTLPLIFEFVNIANDIPDNFKNVISDDLTGDATIECLQKAKKFASRINSIHPSSLGLHPAVYVYSQDGRYKPASFYAMSAFVKDLDRKNMFDNFIKVRKNFEEILLKYEYLTQQIARDIRKAIGGGYVKIKDFYISILDCLNNGIEPSCVINEILKKDQFKSLKLLNNQSEITNAAFSKNNKSAIFLKDVLGNAPRCRICNGYIHKNSISIDHILRKEDGGSGSIENGQITHPYCNSTVKN